MTKYSMCCAVLDHSWLQLFVTPWTVACQAPLSMEILQGRIPEWVSMPSFRWSSQPRDQTQASGMVGRFFTIWTTWEAVSTASVQFSRSVVSDSLRPHELQHARPPCPSPTPGVYSNLCPLSRWCHPAISSSVGPFCSCPQSLPASGSFPISQLIPFL